VIPNQVHSVPAAENPSGASGGVFQVLAGLLEIQESPLVWVYSWIKVLRSLAPICAKAPLHKKQLIRQAKTNILVSIDVMISSLMSCFLIVRSRFFLIPQVSI
jgi:hypothetical protein